VSTTHDTHAKDAHQGADGHGFDHGHATEERDPPATPTFITFIVGSALLVVTVIALDVAHEVAVNHQAFEGERPELRFGAQIKAHQTRDLEQGALPQELFEGKRGVPIDRAIDATVQRYGKR
jgi:hypothetical protein